MTEKAKINPLNMSQMSKGHKTFCKLVSNALRLCGPKFSSHYDNYDYTYDHSSNECQASLAPRSWYYITSSWDTTVGGTYGARVLASIEQLTKLLLQQLECTVN
jgi:hypothetical protein